jgi:hypothetical protein
MSSSNEATDSQLLAVNAAIMVIRIANNHFEFLANDFLLIVRVAIDKRFSDAWVIFLAKYTF